MTAFPHVQPLSRFRRSLYFLGLLAIFVIALPFLYLYATGYRFDGGTTLVSTGGLYVAVEHSGTEIYINGELIRETGAFRRAFYVQDLDPGMYTIAVAREGHHAWEKSLEVFPQIVTEARAFNIPRDVGLVPIPKVLDSDVSQGTTTSVANPLYEEIVEVFAATTTVAELRAASSLPETILPDDEVATTTRESGGMQLSREEDGVVASWTRSSESVPFYFCMPHGACVDEILVGPPDKVIEYFDFLPGDNSLVLLDMEDGVYVSEIDPRDVQNIQPLFLGEAVDARVIDGAIYLKEGTALFEVTL